ncbi:flavin reductase [Streptomyces cyaneofuscatus]|uniref:flavin reductase n=1 Tax=Streptomyces cyaneofuscatus TaxID=66883 RepID=UPI0029535AC8|nr:flavin reductase [Streptomyces cyaneofuscatus]WOP09251.1 flavin reductase [Streptomyces cyaneofuscatus]
MNDDSSVEGHGSIVLEGVTTHNLRSVDVTLPKGKFIVAAGVSGSGKSSLIIDTLFEHSKSIYLGALSSKSLDLGDGDYQFDRIAGIQPPVALRQRDGGYSNPRSTVGTLTGIDGLYRMLFGAASHPVCPVCFGPTGSDLLCSDCGVYTEPHSAQHFSPNRREGKCLHCDGVGELVGFSLDRIVPDPSRTLKEIWDGADSGTFAVPNCRKVFEAMAQDTGIPLDRPFARLTEEQRERVLHGSDTVYSIKLSKVTNDFRFEGILGFLERAYRNASSPARRNAFANYLAREACPACEGGRLRTESLMATVDGRTFPQFQRDELTDSTARLRDALAKGRLPGQVRELAKEIVKQCANIAQVGLGHLQLRRPVVTLSGGELQRLLLAQHLASDLTGVMYVLDEPTAGLHDAETDDIIASLRRLRDLGNTVIAIEHDEAVISAADWVVELGPGAGSRGGEVVFEGPVAELLDHPGSPTAKALHSPPAVRRTAGPDGAEWLDVRSLTRNNVEDQSVRLPLRALTCVTGVSGAGKSSLVASLHEKLTDALKGASGDVEGIKHLDHVTYVEKRPIGRSSRSTLATYIGIGDHIRDAFAGSEEAVEQNLGRSEFSTNVVGGRCEACKGLGLAEVDMTLFRSEHVVCPECDGRRFQAHVLQVRLDGSSIHDVLSMTVEDALAWFGRLGHTKIVKALRVLDEFGLGYLPLGSSTATLSGGEAQRLNLAGELNKQHRGGTLFIFDEPTRGLHPADTRHLLALFERLIASGNTIVAIEHNLRVVAVADWVVDVGPGAGRAGGKVVHCGTPEELRASGTSASALHLRRALEGSAAAPARPAAPLASAPASTAGRPVRPEPAALLRAGADDPLPSAVAVVTGCGGDAADGGVTPRGLTVASLTTVSEEPALIGFLVKAASSSWASIAPRPHFCVNILSDEQADLARAFARTRPDQRFDDVAWAATADGCPRIEGAFGFIECRAAGGYRLGDHILVLGRVLRTGTDGDRRPLDRGELGNASVYGWMAAEEPAETGATT